MSQSQKYREVYELCQLCSNGKDLKEFCIDASINYNKFSEQRLYLHVQMIDERIIELYSSQLAAANEENRTFTAHQ